MINTNTSYAMKAQVIAQINDVSVLIFIQPQGGCAAYTLLKNLHLNSYSSQYIFILSSVCSGKGRTSYMNDTYTAVCKKPGLLTFEKVCTVAFTKVMLFLGVFCLCFCLFAILHKTRMLLCIKDLESKGSGLQAVSHPS